MPYYSQTFEDFGGGLNLKAKVDAVGPNEAINCRNVVFTDRGAVKQRPGHVVYTSSNLTNNVGSLHPFYKTDGTKQLLAGCGSRLEALNTSGGVVASATGLTSTGSPWYWDFCRFGSPNSEYAYAGNGEQTLRRWDGTSWTTVANTPQAGALCVTPTSNRMVASRFKGTAGGPTGGASTSSPSHVYFSNAGAPETWTATDYVQLDPGDGEAIQACIAWRDYVFVFKESKFFVFTNEGTASDGSAIFNYRKVDTGVGLCAPRAVYATKNGVYFVDRTGLYITTGEEPEKLSDPIDPIFTGDVTGSFFTLSVIYHAADADIAMGYWQGMILISYPYSGVASTARYILVYDTEDGWWSIWSTGSGSNADCFANFRPTGVEELVFGCASTSGASNRRVWRMDGTATDDSDEAITSYWRSGFTDFGSPDVKRLRQIKLWGSGGLTLKLSRDYYGTDNETGALDFAQVVGYEPEPALFRRGLRGTTFSIQFYNETQDREWAVYRAVCHFAGTRQATVPKTE